MGAPNRWGNMWPVNPLMCLVPSRLNCGKRKTRLQEPSRSIAQWTIGTFRVDNVITLKSEIIWTGDLGSPEALKVAMDILGLLLCIYLKSIHEVQRLISTGLRDIHNRIKDERIIYSVHVHVWHADCEQNVHSKVTKRLWINFVSVILKKMDIEIRKSLDISAKFTTKPLNTFFFWPQKSLKALQLMNKFKEWNEWVNTWLFRQFCVQEFHADTKTSRAGIAEG